MIALSIYVAAPFDCAPQVRTLHSKLVARGHRRTSRWADRADGPERLAELDDAARERIRVSNHGAIAGSDAMIVLGAEGARETLVELGIALALCLPIAWVDLGARLPLSATCPGVVVLVRTVDQALDALEKISRTAAA